MGEVPRGVARRVLVSRRGQLGWQRQGLGPTSRGSSCGRNGGLQKLTRRTSELDGRRGQNARQCDQGATGGDAASAAKDSWGGARAGLRAAWGSTKTRIIHRRSQWNRQAACRPGEGRYELRQG